MRKLLMSLMVVVLLTLCLPLQAKDAQTQPQLKVEPKVVFTLTEGLEKVKSTDTCVYFEFYDCVIHYGVRYNPDTFTYEVYPASADLIIYCNLTGTYHSVHLDLTSSIM